MDCFKTFTDLKETFRNVNSFSIFCRIFFCQKKSWVCPKQCLFATALQNFQNCWKFQIILVKFPQFWKVDICLNDLEWAFTYARVCFDFQKYKLDLFIHRILYVKQPSLAYFLLTSKFLTSSIWLDSPQFCF